MKYINSRKTYARPPLLWFTGLSGAGKTTLANAVYDQLNKDGDLVYWLDGDFIRKELCSDLGFTENDRKENIRRISAVARLLIAEGACVLVSAISPYRADRDRVRKMFSEDHFLEIYMSASLESCMQRDPKGIYRKANEGKINNFTGISSAYEPPINPELEFNVDTIELEPARNEIHQYLMALKE